MMRLMNTRRAGSILAVVATTLLLAGCANAPSVTDNKLVKKPAKDAPVVSICYSSRSATREQIIALARAECPANAQSLQVWQQDTFSNACPLTKKIRVSFLCRP